MAEPASCNAGMRGRALSIEIDILNGDASWPIAEPLRIKQSGDRTRIARTRPGLMSNGTTRICACCWRRPRTRLVCHVRICLRTIIWNGQKIHVGGIGGVALADRRRRGFYATIDRRRRAPRPTMRANEAVKFALLFCEPPQDSRSMPRASWLPFEGDVYCEQPEAGCASSSAAPTSSASPARRRRAATLDLCGACHEQEACVSRRAGAGYDRREQYVIHRQVRR